MTVDGLLPHGSGSGCIEMPPVIEKLGNVHGLEVAVTVVVVVSVGTVLVSVVSVALVMGSAEAVSVTVTVSGAIGPVPSTEAFGSAAGGGASLVVSVTTLVRLDSSDVVLVMLPCSSCERSPKFCVPDDDAVLPNPSLPDLFPIAIAPPADATITTAATAAYGRCLRASPVVTYSVTRRHVRTNGDATSWSEVASSQACSSNGAAVSVESTPGPTFSPASGMLMTSVASGSWSSGSLLASTRCLLL
ncbi:hypothetical protein [Nocardia sp. NPDC049149]|uniref:hypothetical protein n=1 Tax=Nocardia sp. NPDC049149 TaxID=3364315 RepID=UPI00371BB83F